VFVGSDGSVWAAAVKGLVRWKDGASTLRKDLPCDGLSSVLEDRTGAIWVYGTCGLMSITAGRPRLFDVFDGAQPGSTPFAPPAARAADGRLWFANGSVLQFIDPGRYPANRFLPPVQIEEAVADGVTIQPVNGRLLPAATRHVQIAFTALSLGVPQKVRFRFRLDGVDEQWQEAGTRRQAFYTELRPGQYRFRVMACNNDGLWNEAEAVWTFRVDAFYYQTLWFRAALLAAAGLLLWALYQFRLRQVAAGMNARFDERIAERNRLSSELQDAFLQSVQASRMIAELALRNETADMRPTMVTLAEWLARAASEGETALNSISNSITHKNDLAEALRRAAEAFCSASAMAFELSVEGAAREMHPIVRDEILRIGSEAIRNACARPGGKHLKVLLKYGRHLTLLIRDDGIGAGSALSEAIREAAGRIRGRLRLSASSHSGTQVKLTVPGKIAFYQGKQ
jgi:signal transduction histidine kinase